MKTYLNVLAQDFENIKEGKVTEVLILFDKRFEKGRNITLLGNSSPEVIQEVEVKILEVNPNYAGSSTIKYLNLFLQKI